MNQNKTVRRNFILIAEHLYAKRKDRSKNLTPVETELEVLIGHLFEEIAIESSPKTGKNLALKSLELEGVVLTCTPDNVKQIEAHESDVLLGVSNSRDRMRVYQDKDWLKEGGIIDIDNDVDYIANVNSESRSIPAKVRYKGTVCGYGKGTMFGIELIGHPGKGKCDGSVGKKKIYFKCEPDCGLFVPISRIRLRWSSYPNSLDYMHPRLSLEKVDDTSTLGPPLLKINDRVVWLSDSGPEYGVVQWIGKLPQVGHDWTVGVEFDNPVGTGTGKYKEQQLFVTPVNHASLIPILGLMRAEDWSPDGAANTISNHAIRSGPGDNWEQPEAMSPTTAETANTRVQQLDLPRDNQNNLNKLINRGTHLINVESDGVNDYISIGEKVNRLNPELVHLGINDDNWSTEKSNEQEVLNPLYARTVEEEFGGDIFLSDIDVSYDLEVGSVVEVSVSSKPKYGVIKWIGMLPGKTKKIAGLEMEDETLSGTDGTFEGKHYFDCPSKKAFFVYLSQCKKDARFASNSLEKMNAAFGSMESPVIPGHIPPPNVMDNVEAICGKMRGIQGHHNSCYLDATLFSMFAFTYVFDSLLQRPAMPTDLIQYGQVQTVLREEIVNPLRKNFYVRADRVMKLRTLLDRLSSVTGLTTEEKDPEEFLNSLLQQILKAEPFLKLSSGQEAYFYQLFVEKDEGIVLPRVQQLFEQSFLASDIKLKEIPPCLIIQMPRFGKQYKMYPRIVPSLNLDITDVLENSPRNCSICGNLAEFECKDCFRHFGEGLESIAFCAGCVKQSHNHKRRVKHIYRSLSVPSQYLIHKDKDLKIPRIYMELFAVVCIETSHYVAFVKCGSGPEAPWCFFDSMADRKGEQNGYNIPELVACPDLINWLSEEGCHLILNTQDDKQLPEHARRLLGDAYMCMYQSPDVMMYR